MNHGDWAKGWRKPRFGSGIGGVISLTTVMALFISASINGAAGSEPPQFILHSAEGINLKGPLLELKDDWSIRQGDPKTSQTPGDKLVTLCRAGTSPPALSIRKPQILFANGDRLAAKALELTKGRIRFQLDGEATNRMEAPLSSIAVIWLDPAGNTKDLEKLRWRLANEPSSQDVIHLRNGDAQAGILKGFDAAKVLMEANRKSIEIQRDKVAAIALNTGLTTTLRPKGPYGLVVLANGSRLSLTRASCSDGKTVKGTALFGAAVAFPVEDVMAVYLLQGRAVYLSDLKPRSYEMTPFDNVLWPFVKDGSVTACDLRLDGGLFAKGLGMHSASRLTYDVPKESRRFEALVGIDERPENRTDQARARVKVLVDGKPRDIKHDEELTGRSRPIVLEIDVAGAKQITLIVDYGKLGAVHGHVDWVDARFIK